MYHHHYHHLFYHTKDHYLIIIKDNTPRFPYHHYHLYRHNHHHYIIIIIIIIFTSTFYIIASLHSTNSYVNRAAIAAVDKFTDPRGFKYPASVSMLAECLKPDIIRGLNEVFIQLNYG
jgi:hypothetical protein